MNRALIDRLKNISVLYSKDSDIYALLHEAAAALSDERDGVSKPSKRTLRKRMKELRQLIDTSKDVAEVRIAYGMETAIRWATEDTVGWERPVLTAIDLAKMLHTELKDKP